MSADIGQINVTSLTFQWYVFNHTDSYCASLGVVCMQISGNTVCMSRQNCFPASSSAGANIKIQKTKDSVLLECYTVLSCKDLPMFLRPARS